ncbi:glutamate-5-semialdehyde dehydrogenase [Shewanella litorisediminis]|uniref:Gamma-glutamyl phosphate reductase n=1 Tax=Shewanella litorisediminis TaxID=1173586 RepID=A0ABX7G0J6_9GAMM|nr:glutamate-5-semialdehyde dehydrogenase [Shewanella litorisediminis]MCL2918144.1 glutamate-5-semialdehyde dehydrogenase [Shewanella litorisediminis]QRH00800.1 glutamate-5-semialdehyde dehydrogenase [Shewanella litorisediminis]
MDTQAYLLQLGQAAKRSGFALANLGVIAKNRLLGRIGTELQLAFDDILAANGKDVAAARASGLGEAMIDRLLLNEDRLKGIIADIDNVISLADPIGEEFDSRLLDNGMRLCRRRVPLGVIGVIYEARPNVTVEIAVLALKTGNAVILRGGKETRESNIALAAAIRRALASEGLPEDCVQLIDNPDRALVSGLLKLDKFVDMIVPRGGQGLQRLCAEQATIPVILGGIGICHLYLDKDADTNRAADVIINAKVQRPTVCNALDTLLIHQDKLGWLPKLAQSLQEKGVKLVACEQSRKQLDGAGIASEAASDESFGTEWLSLTLGVKVVSDIDEAIAHIRHYSSGHSEAILTDNLAAATHFMNEVNSAAVYLNASTRFTDGGQFGLGAEVAVSTQKLHARGPMGLEALTTYKWLGIGDYTCR